MQLRKELRNAKLYDSPYRKSRADEETEATHRGPKQS